MYKTFPYKMKCNSYLRLRKLLENSENDFSKVTIKINLLSKNNFTPKFLFGVF